VLETEQIMDLAIALEIKIVKDSLSVKDLLDAPNKRSDVCYNGIFNFLVAVDKVDPDEER